MKNFILCLLLSMISLNVFAQIQNGGFETWEDVFLYESPDDWRTTHTEVPGTDAVAKNTDAQDGSYSVHLKTVAISGETRFGYVLKGDADDDDYTGKPYSGTISGIQGYYKSDIMEGDSALILVAGSYQGEDYEAEMFYLHGEETDWTAFSFTFAQSMQVDSVTIGIASSDAINESAVEGSWIRVDNISFVGSNAPPIGNHSFEVWNDVNYDKPDGWSITQYGAGVVESVVKSTNSHNGTYAVELVTLASDLISGDTVSGILTNGTIHDMDSLFFSGGVPFTLEPDTFMGFYSTTDTINGLIRFWNNSTEVSHEYIQLFPAGNSYQAFALPLNLTGTPDSMLIYFFGGNELGSSLLLDDLTLVGGNVGILELDIVNNFKTYPNPSAEVLYFTYSINKYSSVQIAIYDILGRSVFNGQEQEMKPGIHTGELNIADLNTGTYLFNLIVNGESYEQKIMVE